MAAAKEVEAFTNGGEIAGVIPVTEGTTQAVASVKVSVAAVIAAGVLAVLSVHHFPLAVLLPAVIINMTFLQISHVHGAIYSAIQLPWMAAIFYPVQRLFSIPLAWALLFVYTPIPVILFRKRSDQHGLFGRLFIRYIWDPPLLATIFFVGATRLGGSHLLTPFCTVIDDRIVIGSLPLPKDVATLRGHSIGAVVNMCAEYKGPVKEYAAHGIRQLRLPTVDTSSPSFEQLQEGVEFIEQSMKDQPGKRVFIHCKGGRGRAAAMATCYYLKAKGGGPKEVVRWLKSKRHVVSGAVSQYEAVRMFHQQLVADSKRWKE